MKWQLAGLDTGCPVPYSTQTNLHPAGHWILRAPQSGSLVVSQPFGSCPILPAASRCVSFHAAVAVCIVA
jgi:hypothetical protein